MSTSNTNSSEEDGGPEIPNYEIFRTIGRGAYGEVWLARSVTGTFRAVKVVRRSNFESDRAFEREFEGIQRYEEVSQEHHGLVDILHVGRDDEQGFYYYVMELADDVKNGREIEPDTYAPLSLTSKLKAGEKMPVQQCLDLGCALAEGLGQLHKHKLTHRDVKPSNIIFIRDRPTLADPGLVALSGQNTFVGTEGYVPPEGPGKPQADLYSLGVVLYEMNTGKDRLEFPELPTIVDRGEECFEERNALNTIICNACAPRPSQRYQTAAALHEALSGVGRDVRREKIWHLLPARMTAALAILAGCAMFALVFRSGPEPQPSDPQTPPPSELAGTPANPVEPQADPETQAPSVASTDPPATDPVADPQPETSTDNQEPPLVAMKTEPDPVPVTVPADPDTPPIAMTDPGQNGSESSVEPQPEITPAPEFGSLKIHSFPPHAKVFIGGKETGTTPLTLEDWQAGEYDLLFKMENYKDELVRAKIEGNRSTLLHADLSLWMPPKAGESWENSLGMPFRATTTHGGHRSAAPLHAREFEVFAAEHGTDNLHHLVGLEELVYADGKSRFEFCQWLTNRDREMGYLSQSLVYLQEVDEPLDGYSDLASFYLVVDEPQTGTILVSSDPPGATVYDPAGLQLGTTPLAMEDTDLGPVKFEVRKPGYGAVALEGTVDHVEPLELAAILEPNKSVIFGYPWSNSLGMRFVPIRNLMVSVFETRVADYEAFWKTEGDPDRYFEPDFAQGPSHPVVNVKLADALRFCEWLTKEERKKGLIQPHQLYRLPTDQEWSLMAGLTEEQGSTPEERDGGVKDVYPWGTQWPPPANAGNFADSSATQVLGDTIPDYEDGFVRTSPVGSFEPNKHGLYDVAGNVWEWISEPYSANPDSNYVAMRGGSWQDYRKDILQTSTRNVTPPRHRFIHWGFRVVLAEDPSLIVVEAKH